MGINVASSFLVVISHMLEWESHATTRNTADKWSELKMHSLHMLIKI